jgi:uncharacterized protein (DUF4415 family)
MPNPPSDEPLTKVTLNLFTRDLQRLQRQEGHGWSTKVRQLVRDYLRRTKSDE